jgi:phosphoserine phosphatase RsbU/P
LGKPLRVLIVEDSEDDVELLLRALRKGGYEVDHKVVETPEAMRALLVSRKWDLITSDHAMPRFNAPDALSLAKEYCPDVPFLIVSGEIELNLAVSLIKAGAIDYVQKFQQARLLPAVARALEEAEMRRERFEVEQAVQNMYRRFQEVLENSLDASFKRIIQTND